jgi:hypothetical protein
VELPRPRECVWPGRHPPPARAPRADRGCARAPRSRQSPVRAPRAAPAPVHAQT